jgi:Ni/Co efflux regulator RcnB
MRSLALVVLTLAWMGGAAYAQPHDDHNRAANGNSHAAPNHAAPAARAMPTSGPTRGPAMNNHQASGAAMRGPGHAGGHHLPPGIAVPTAHHGAPNWHGRSWAVGDTFVLTGFNGPIISAWTNYGLTPPRRGTHWIYVDGWYLMIGNRTGRIFAEIPADY